MILLGIDIGSSSIKVSLVDADKGNSLVSVYYPLREMKIISKHPGWAEQDPEIWMENIFHAINAAKAKFKGNLNDIGAIGITYQMHGLVAIDKEGKLIRNAIIWCDSRAVEIGNEAMEELGEEYCIKNLLNSPGNFTASKLKWVKENEPGNYNRIFKIMLPGDYVAYRLTGNICTTVSGLSEGIFYDFESNDISTILLDYFGIDKELIPQIVPAFSIQGQLKKEIADHIGLKPGIPISYRSGDQPNNAFSLNVLEPGEIAATAGTSGVVYGISDDKKTDFHSRVNTFIHVNHAPSNPRFGVLLCVNGTGILNSWLKHQIIPNGMNYSQMNELASKVPSGSDGLMVFPFGNGSERILQNKNINAAIQGLNFNTHSRNHLMRAAQEGIGFALMYGMEIMQNTGMEIKILRAAMANMFLSKLFCQTLSNLSGAEIELYDTDGAQGAAKGAGIGIGYFKNEQEALSSLHINAKVDPQHDERLKTAYKNWKTQLEKMINTY